MAADLFLSAGFYGANCIALILVGLGVMRALRLTSSAHDVLLAPIVSVAAWAIVLGLLVQTGFAASGF